MMWKIQIVSTDYFPIQNDGVLVGFNQTQGLSWCAVFQVQYIESALLQFDEFLTLLLFVWNY